MPGARPPSRQCAPGPPPLPARLPRACPLAPAHPAPPRPAPLQPLARCADAELPGPARGRLVPTWRGACRRRGSAARGPWLGWGKGRGPLEESQALEGRRRASSHGPGSGTAERGFPRGGGLGTSDRASRQLRGIHSEAGRQPTHPAERKTQYCISCILNGCLSSWLWFWSPFFTKANAKIKDLKSSLCFCN